MSTAVQDQPAVSARREEPAHTTFIPYIPASVTLPELTALALILGTLLGMVFGASSLYLVLKVGLTVSASIPVAVISLTLFRLWSKFGGPRRHHPRKQHRPDRRLRGRIHRVRLGVTMPAIMILGFDLELTRVMLVALLGGLLGILMMIPLRRALIVEQHGQLKYPEGTACAEVLKAGASPSRGNGVETAQREAAAAALAESAAPAPPPSSPASASACSTRPSMSAFKAGRTCPKRSSARRSRPAPSRREISPELLGVGYIIGPRSSIMCAGGVLAYLVLIPLSSSSATA